LIGVRAKVDGAGIENSSILTVLPGDGNCRLRTAGVKAV